MTDTPLQDFFKLLVNADEETARDWLNKNFDKFSPSMRKIVRTVFEEYVHEKKRHPVQRQEWREYDTKIDIFAEAKRQIMASKKPTSPPDDDSNVVVVRPYKK